MKLKTALLGAAACLAMAPAALAERGADGDVQRALLAGRVDHEPLPVVAAPRMSRPSSLVVEPLAGFDEKGKVFAAPGRRNSRRSKTAASRPT